MFHFTQTSIYSLKIIKNTYKNNSSSKNFFLKEYNTDLHISRIGE